MDKGKLHETIDSTSVDVVAIDAIGGNDLSGRYYRSFRFIGTIAGLCFSVTSNYAGFLMPLTIISYINKDIGPSPNYIWVPLVWSICVSLGYTLNGRLSDLFGRRYFVVGGNIVALIGGIIAATAKDIPSLIGANIFIGLGSAVQLSFNTVTSELVPVKDRGFWLGLILLAAVPTAMFGPYFSHALLAEASWRWCYYLFVILDGLACILLTVCYFPPSFKKLHTVKTKTELAKHLDFLGIFLYVGGVVLFLLGVSWGGNVYPWKSAAVISTLIIGLVMLVLFFFWESRAEQALIPLSFFTTNKRLFLAPLLTGMGGGMFFYGLNIIWPLQVATIYGAGGLKNQGWLTCTLTTGSGLGAIMGAMLFKTLGHHRLQLITLYVIMIAFCAAISTTNINTRPLALASSFFMGLGTGAVETIVVLIALVSKEVGNIGLIVGSIGTFRSLAGSIAQAVYTTILSNKLKTEIPTLVTKAALGAGLPASSLPALFKAIASQSPAALLKVPGMTKQIALAVEGGELEGYTQSFKYVYYASCAFGAASLIAALFVEPDVNRYMTSFVARKLEGVPAVGIVEDPESLGRVQSGQDIEMDEKDPE